MLSDVRATREPTDPEPGGVPHDAKVAAGPEPVERSPLLAAALALVPPAVTASELGGRFAAAGAVLREGLPESLLHGLVDLGLVRVTRMDDLERRYVPTTLGTRAIDAGVHGAAAIPLEELERLRTDLLSTIAHELRTPLTAVRTSVGLLREPDAHPTEEQRTKLLGSIERNADRMQRLISDILELSRFRAGGVALQLRSFAAHGLAEAAIAVIAPLAVSRRQRIELDPGGAPPEHRVYGDRRRLERALLNLIANAQRFAPDGGAVRVRVERRGQQTAWTVRDDGPGISEADQSRLFERFFVGRNDRSGTGDGVGLGLPTALAIAQAHGGTIGLTSALGQGSEFGLVVPTAGPEGAG